MRRDIASFLVGSVLLVGGCSLEPAYERPKPPVAATYPQETPKTAAPGNLAASADIGWQDFFHDARLQRLIALSLQNNRDMRIAILNVEKAQGQYRIERAGLFPTLAGNADWSRARTPADESFLHRTTIGDTTQVTANASWELDLFGKTRSLTHEALDQFLALAATRKATEISLISEVANQYFTLQSYDETLAITRQALAADQNEYRLAQVQFNAGTSTALDLAQAETAVDEAQANLEQETRLRAQAENALVLLIGASLPADLALSGPLVDDSVLTDIPAGLPSDLLERRPDIISAEYDLKADNAAIGAARAAFFPSISLTGEYGTASTSLNGLFSSNRAVWSFGPSVNLPVFEGGTNLAQLAVAKSTTAIAVAQYEQDIQTAFREVADGLDARRTYDLQVAALRRDVAASGSRLQLSHQRYEAGIDPYLQVLTAETDLYTAQVNLVSTRLARLSALVDLYQYLGGGWVATTGKPSPLLTNPS